MWDSRREADEATKAVSSEEDEARRGKRTTQQHGMRSPHVPQPPAVQGPSPLFSRDSRTCSAPDVPPPNIVSFPYWAWFAVRLTSQTLQLCSFLERVCASIASSGEQHSGVRTARHLDVVFGREHVVSRSDEHRALSQGVSSGRGGWHEDSLFQKKMVVPERIYYGQDASEPAKHLHMPPATPRPGRAWTSPTSQSPAPENDLSEFGISRAHFDHPNMAGVVVSPPSSQLALLTRGRRRAAGPSGTNQK